MTTVAWDGRIIAVDKQITDSDGGKSTSSKLFSINSKDCVAAYYGNCALGIEFLDWLENDTKDFRVPEYSRAALMVIKDRRCFVYEGKFPFLIEDKFTAAGSGAPYALSAMALGLNAVDAIKHASKFNAGTGMGIDWYDTETEKFGKRKL